MAKRIRINEGDIFEVTLNDQEVGYFQYLLLDPCQLNSEVIRVFRYRSTPKKRVDLHLIVGSGVDFYAHTIIKVGINVGCWKKIGNLPLEDDFVPPLFRDTFGQEEEYDGNRIIYKKSNSWNIWRAGAPFQSRKNIGYLTKKYLNVDLGEVEPFNEIIHKMKTGEYSYPNYT